MHLEPPVLKKAFSLVWQYTCKVKEYRMTFKSSLVSVLMLSLGILSLGAQDPAPAPTPPQFGLGVGLGTELIDGVTFQSVGITPDFALGPFGIGMNVKINYRFYRYPGDEMGFYARPQDWIVDKNDDGRPDSDGTFQEYLDLYLSKIVYLRYGLKGQPLYLKVGLFEDGTLGNGFILGRYSNGILRPDITSVGLAADVDGALFNFPVVGVETFTNSISTWDLLGGRVYVRPLKLVEGLGFFDELQIGFTLVADQDPASIYNRLLDKTNLELEAAGEPLLSEVSADPVVVYGVDFREPLVNLPVFSLALFGDMVFQDQAMGIMGGLGGQLLGVVGYTAQVRYLGENFQPTYFDRGYDLKRLDKYGVYQGYLDTPAFAGWFAQLGTNLLEGQVAFFASLEGPLGAIESADENNAALWPKLRSSFKLDGTKILPVPLSLDAYYDKDFIKDLKTLFSAEDAVIGAKLNYQVGAATLSLVYNVRYIPSELQVPGQDPWEVSSKLETAIKLF